MARAGLFQGPSDGYATPGSFAHPPDNSFPKWAPEVAKLRGLTDAERDRLQDEIDELVGIARLPEQWS